MTDTPQITAVLIPNKDLDRARKANERKKKQEEKEKERNAKATAKKKNSKNSSGPFAFLDSTNDWLEQVPTRMIAAYYNFIGNGEQLAQSKVDKICAWLAWKVNIAVERKRQTILRILHGQYKSTVAGKVMAVAGAVKSFCNDPLGALGEFASAIFGPIAAIFKWGAELAVQVVRLGFNLANIMTALPPAPPSPYINYDKFKLKIRGISMSDVMTDPNNLPSPEAMFPEPPKPFTKEVFMLSFEEDSAALKSGRMKYTLSTEDAEALSNFSNYSISDFIKKETATEDTIPSSIY